VLTAIQEIAVYLSVVALAGWIVDQTMRDVKILRARRRR
jgi:hypothetical protein